MRTPRASIILRGALRSARPRAHHLARPLPGCLLLALGLVLAGCGSGNSVPMPRETFIETVVALRSVAVRSTEGEVDPISRARILEERGLTEDDLLDFVEVHGRDVPFMAAVWEEIDNEMSRRARDATQGAS